MVPATFPGSGDLGRDAARFQRRYGPRRASLVHHMAGSRHPTKADTAFWSTLLVYWRERTRKVVAQSPNREVILTPASHMRPDIRWLPTDFSHQVVILWNVRIFSLSVYTSSEAKQVHSDGR